MQFQRSSLPVRHALWRAPFHPTPLLIYFRSAQFALCTLIKRLVITIRTKKGVWVTSNPSGFISPPFQKPMDTWRLYHE
jgi:hypothetical protein